MRIKLGLCSNQPRFRHFLLQDLDSSCNIQGGTVCLPGRCRRSLSLAFSIFTSPLCILSILQTLSTHFTNTLQRLKTHFTHALHTLHMLYTLYPYLTHSLHTLVGSISFVTHRHHIIFLWSEMVPMSNRA